MNAVIDASALIAFLRDESGADVVERVLASADKCWAHALNLCEVYYDFWRASNQDAAEAAITDLIGLGIEERADMDSEFLARGRAPQSRAPQGFTGGLLRVGVGATSRRQLGFR